VYKAYCKNIVVLILTLACVSVYGQQPSFQGNAGQTDTIKNKFFRPVFSNIPANEALSARAGSMPHFNIRASQSPLVVSGLQKDHYIKEFGFFCKKEMQIEKSIKVPLRFRLGSLEQCNILEEKY
jgi:hypothetical protein